MKTLFSILLLLFSINSFSQTPKQLAYIDSVLIISITGATDSLKCAARHDLGSYYFRKLRDFANGATYLYDALELANSPKTERLKGEIYASLSWMEDRKSNKFKALEYMRKSSEIFSTLDDEYSLFRADYNLGSMLKNAKKLDEAEKFLIKALNNSILWDRYNWTMNSYMVLGNLYSAKGDNQKALGHLLKAAKKSLEHRGDYGNGRLPASLAELYLDLDDQSNTNKWINEAYECVKRKNDNLFYKEYYFSNFKIKRKQGRANEALVSYELFIQYKDSLFNQKILTASNEAEQKYLNDIKTLEDDKLKAEKKLIESEKQRAEQKTIWLTIIIILVLIALLITFFRFKATREKNIIIEKQKEEVEEKNKEITDSINYAKRIQAAILPAPNIVKKYLTDSFILYKPKDIVAGDFYWLQEDTGSVLFAAADCTGHGVPGAMVSVVCNNALNRAVREYNLSKPSEILDKTRDIVCEEFVKSEEDKVSDGMDIALCSFTRIDGKPQIQFAGAHNPLWILRDNDIIEIKGDRQPIGHFVAPTPFVNHEIDLQQGDYIYIFSDGFPDQFGGEDDRKFNKKNFKKLILSIQEQSMEEQKDSLNEAFETWRGDLEQIDDVCVIGVKIV